MRTFANLDDQLKFHYVVHTSLDMVEEKGLSLFKFREMFIKTLTAVNVKKASNAATILDSYLGMLYPTEDYKVYENYYFSRWCLFFSCCRYGYITNTKIKLIVVIDDSYTEIKEAELRTVSSI